MYVRFVVRQRLSKSKYESGLFLAAEHLKGAGELGTDEAEFLEELLEWFQLHLPVPHASQRDERAIYWYKPSAREHIRRMWELTHLLEIHGYDVEMITTEFAGLLIYQDEFQIAAIPRTDRHR